MSPDWPNFINLYVYPKTGLHPGVCVGGGGDTLLFSYIRRFGPFFWFKILNFNIFGGFQQNEYFLGYGFVDISMVSSQNLPSFRGHFYAFWGLSLRSMCRMGIFFFFFMLLQFQILSWCFILLIFFGLNGRWFAVSPPIILKPLPPEPQFGKRLVCQSLHVIIKSRDRVHSNQ